MDGRDDGVGWSAYSVGLGGMVGVNKWIGKKVGCAGYISGWAGGLGWNTQLAGVGGGRRVTHPTKMMQINRADERRGAFIVADVSSPPPAVLRFFPLHPAFLVRASGFTPSASYVLSASPRLPLASRFTPLASSAILFRYDSRTLRRVMCYTD